MRTVVAFKSTNRCISYLYELSEYVDVTDVSSENIKKCIIVLSQHFYFQKKKNTKNDMSDTQ